MSLDSFQEFFSSLFDRGGHHGGGGRRPNERNQDALDSDDEQLWLKPLDNPRATRLTIVQITDVYTLDNFPSLKTMLQHIRDQQQIEANGKSGGSKVISMLTGDFLAPYLLSSIDHGKGMMMALNETPIDYLTWGNHEADIPHNEVLKRVKSYKGTFINSNMQDHESMKYDCSVPYEVLEVTSEDGSQTRKIGFIAVLSNDPKLYSHFKQPAFGGATIEDPWETLRHYKHILEEEHACDIVIPLEHMYVPENTKTCQEFDFPIILSGHDHHRIDQMIHGTRLIKPGMDGVFAAVVELCWDDASCTSPLIRSTFVDVADMFEPCLALKEKTDAAYNVLLPLRNTMLAGILPAFRPLTSKNARGSVTTMGKLICSMLKEALWQTHAREEEGEEDNISGANDGSTDDKGNITRGTSPTKKIDAVILMGGNIRGNEDYPDDSFFSLETLEAEIKPDEVVGFVDMPGHILAAGIEATHAGDPIPGWFQYDDGIVEENGKIIMVNGKPIQPNRVYRVATKIKDLTNGQSPPLTNYYKSHPELLPAKGQYINIHSELMDFFARGMFRKLWEAVGEIIPDPEVVAEQVTNPNVNMEHIEGRLRVSVLDLDGDGYVTVDDIHVALRDFLGLSVDDNYKSLATAVHSCADATGNGKVTVEDFEVFCSGMPRELKMQAKWDDAFPDPLPDLSSNRSYSSRCSGSIADINDTQDDFPLEGTDINATDQASDVENLSGDDEENESALPPTEITFAPGVAAP